MLRKVERKPVNKKASALLFLAALFSATSCIVDISRNNTTTITGKVVDVSIGGNGGENDITITLAHNDSSYYINRGLDKFTLKAIRDTLINSKISLTYAKSFFQPTFRHITEIKKGSDVVFSEY